MKELRKNKTIGLACLSCGFFSSSQALLFVLYPVLAQKLRLSISEVVFCFSAGSFLFLWGAPFWSLQSDRYGRSRILLITQLGVLFSLFALALLLLPISTSSKLNFVILLLSRLVYGAVASGLVPVSQAQIMDSAEESHRVKAATTHSIFLNTGRFLGPVIGLTIAFIAPLTLVAALCVVFLILVLVQIKTLPASEPRFATDRKIKLQHIWPDTKDKQGITCLAFLTTVFLGILQSSLGAYLHFAFGFTAAEASAWMAKLLIVGAVSTVVIQIFLRSKMKDPWQGSLPFGAGVLAFGLTIFLLWHSEIALYLSVIFMSFGVAMITPSYMSAMSILSGREQGKSAGVLSIAHTLGYAVGGGLTTLGLMFNERVPFLFAVGIVLLIFTTFPAIYSGRKSFSQLREPEHAQ